MATRTGIVRWLIGLSAVVVMAGSATASIITYHVTGITDTSIFGVPGGLPVTLEFSIEDSTPPSFEGANKAEYIGALTSGFVRVGTSTFPFIDFNVIAINNDDDMLDQFLLVTNLGAGPAVPGLGQAELVVLVLSTLAPAPTPPLSGVSLMQTIPPVSAFDGGNIQLQFVGGDVLSSFIAAGPLPGPAPNAVPEPPLLALLLATLPTLAFSSRRWPDRERSRRRSA